MKNSIILVCFLLASCSHNIKWSTVEATPTRTFGCKHINAETFHDAYVSESWDVFTIEGDVTMEYDKRCVRIVTDKQQ